MLTIAQEMLEENDLCVLATCSNELPNSSLMHYIFDGPAMNIYMLTLKGSVKYNNITANPQVSLLVDTRADLSRPGQTIKALTVYGKAGFVEDPQTKQDLIRELVNKTPNLASMASDSQCMVIQVHAEKLLLLDGINSQSMINV